MNRRVRIAGLAVVVLGLVAVLAASVLSRSQPRGVDGDASQPTPTPTTTSDPSPEAVTPSPTPSADTVDPQRQAEVDRALLTSPHLAARADASALREAAARMAAGPWQDLIAAPWQATATEVAADGPVYVATATLASDRVEVDVVVATTWTDAEQAVLRLLPAAAALGDNALEVTVRVDGDPADATVDRDGARLLVVRPDTATADEVVLDIDLAYDVPTRESLGRDDTSAGIGLVARSAGTTALGHWLPLVTTADGTGPIEPGGDVSAFPSATFSVVVAHDGLALVTGGDEVAAGEACHRDDVTDCTWVRGVGVRDVSAVLLEDATQTGHAWTGGSVVAWAPAGAATADGLADLAAESAEHLDILADALGALPWQEVDVVEVPLAPGALGMEFPGMVWLDRRARPEPGGDLGSYVLAHEMGHQWFHALVGNSSLTDPVVDEATAQYLSYLVFAERFGQADADALDARSISGRHASAVADGVPDEAPAMPLGAFASPRSYGANVYGRGGGAWIQAEDAAAREAVLDVLRTVVERHGMGEVTAPDVLAIADEIAPSVADVLRERWAGAAAS